jgi:hypothetical protein
MVAPDLTQEILILRLNLESPHVPHVRIDGNHGIIEGTEEQFKALFDMMVDQFDFQTDEDWCED